MSELRAERRLAAILAADVAGYSRLMESDEEGTLAALKAIWRELCDPKIAEYRGRVVKTTGDGMLAEFASVVDAVRCAAEMQRAMIDRNAEISRDKRIQFRIGVNLGDVIVDDGDIFGDGVNIAARLEALATPDGICISGTVREHVGDRLPYVFEDLGEQSVKNLARPVRVYALSAAAVAVLPSVIGAAEIKPSARTSALRLSIVVLPFVNLSNDPEQEYFADGVTDDVTTDLSRIHDSFVISRNTAFTYKGRAVDVRQIGRELGVRYVLEGSVRRLGEQVQINVQLIDAATGAHIWADRFNTSRIDLAIAEDEITIRLASALRVELVEAVGRRIEQEPLANLEARDFCMRGWAWFHRPVSASQLQEAEWAFEQALALDPGSADAKAGLTLVILTAGVVGLRERDLVHCERLLNEALERESNHVRSVIALGWVRQLQERYAESRILLEKAIALDRNSATAQARLGFTLHSLGEPQMALPHFERAVQLSPRDPNRHWYYNGLGGCHMLLGNLDLAIDFLLKARSGNPRIYEFSMWLAATYGLLGDLAKAKEALAAFHELTPEVTSLAKLRAFAPRLFISNSEWLDLSEKTWVRGLRLAGLPDA